VEFAKENGRMVAAGALLNVETGLASVSTKEMTREPTQGFMVFLDYIKDRPLTRMALSYGRFSLDFEGAGSLLSPPKIPDTRLNFVAACAGRILCRRKARPVKDVAGHASAGEAVG